MLKNLVRDAIVLWASIYAFASLAITVCSLPLIATEGFSYFAVRWLFFINLTWQTAALVVFILAVVFYLKWRSEQK